MQGTRQTEHFQRDMREHAVCGCASASVHTVTLLTGGFVVKSRHMTKRWLDDGNRHPTQDSSTVTSR